MLAPGGEVTERSAWSDFTLQSHRLYPAFVAELREESGCPIDYQRDGATEIADAADWAYLLERATLLVDLHLGERLRVFAEGISGIIAGESRPAPPVQNDPIPARVAALDMLPQQLRQSLHAPALRR